MIIVTSAIIMNFVSLQVRFSCRNFLEEPSFFFGENKFTCKHWF